MALKGPITAIAAVGAVLSGLVGYYTTYKTVATVAVSSGATPAPATQVSPLSIIVLPFANQTGDASKTYIAEALTGSISADLNRIRDAAVVPAATAFTYKDKGLTVAQVAQREGVRFALQGSVVASGDQLRIAIQLTDTQSGRQLWDERFEGEAARLFELQDRVTARVGASIGREMVIVAARDSVARVSNPKVADLILRARAAYLRPVSEATFREMATHYRSALKLEPQNPVALAGLAAALCLQASYSGEPQSQQIAVIDEAQDLALKAQAIDPSDPFIYLALFSHAELHGDFAAARRYNEKRLELDPRNPRAYANMSASYTRDGDWDKALAVLNKGLALTPKPDDLVAINLADVHLGLGHNDQAIEWALKVLDSGLRSESALSVLARAHTNLGQLEQARRYADEYRKLMAERGQRGAIDKLPPHAPAAWVRYYNEHLLPEWRKAGLPE